MTAEQMRFGIFYAFTLIYNGFVPPCYGLMPITATSGVGQRDRRNRFSIVSNNKQCYTMSEQKNICLSGNNSTLQSALTSRNEAKLISTSNFLGREINVYGSADNPYFFAKDVAEWLELSNVSDMISRIDEEERSKFNLGRQGEGWFLTEDGLYEVLFQSRKPIAKQFKKGVKEILKSIRRTGEFSASKKPSISDKMKAATWAAKFLNLNESSKLLIAKSIADPLGLPTPDYTPSHGILKSASELLKENGCAMSAQAFNAKLMELGYLTELTRPSSKGGVKKFKSITEKGLEYGENQVNPNNPKSTQPLWYADRFNELVSIAN